MIPTHELAVASIALFVGLIHGTWDWVVVPRTIRDIWLPNIVIVTILYTVISVPHVLLWYFEPSIGILIFLVFTVLHWGEEELHFTINRLGFTDFRGLYHKILLIVARGGMTVIYPLVFYSHDYQTVINAILDLFNSEGLQWLFVQDVRYTLAAIVTISLIVYFTLALLYSPDYIAISRCFLTDLKLAIWFLFMPVAVSIPVYLDIQHSSIHIGRVRKV